VPTARFDLGETFGICILIFRDPDNVQLELSHADVAACRFRPAPTGQALGDASSVTRRNDATVICLDIGLAPIRPWDR
jgi:hypothetical protein